MYQAFHLFLHYNTSREITQEKKEKFYKKNKHFQCLIKFFRGNKCQITDITELKIDAAKLELGIAYVMKDSVINELNRKELYEVKLPIKLPTSSINLLYLKGQLTNVDKNFIKNYLKK